MRFKIKMDPIGMFFRSRPSLRRNIRIPETLESKQKTSLIVERFFAAGGPKKEDADEENEPEPPEPFEYVE